VRAEQGVPQGQVGGLDLPPLVSEPDQRQGRVAAMVGQRGDQPVQRREDRPRRSSGAGWQRQQQSRRLSPEFVRRRERVVRRFPVFTGGWPWCWTAGQLEAWVAGGGWAHSTVRLYQGSLACFLDYVCDPPELGGFGVLHVRFGKAMRGSPPRRRAVATVMPWAAEALEQYLAEVRPRYGASGTAALWLTERGERISARSVDDRFALARAAAGLPAELSVRCLRHSFVSHLIEDGVGPLFVQQQAGHSWASTTATYTRDGGS
jgi:integrase/recombinase XerC